jgi:hypothetical protein
MAAFDRILVEIEFTEREVETLARVHFIARVGKNSSSGVIPVTGNNANR